MADSAPINLKSAVLELRRIKHENAKLLQKQKLLEAELKTVTNTFIFPFLRLSRELRDMIYKELFEGADPVLIVTASCCKWPPQRRFPVAVLRTCRQIYEEALPTLYGGDQVFQFCGDSCLSHFLASIGEAARNIIRSLDVSFCEGPFVGIHALLRDCGALRNLTLRMRHEDTPQNGRPSGWQCKRGFEDLCRLRGLEKVDFGRFEVITLTKVGRCRYYAMPRGNHKSLLPLEDDSDLEPDSNEESDDDDGVDGNDWMGLDGEWLTADTDAGTKLREQLTRPRTT